MYKYKCDNMWEIMYVNETKPEPSIYPGAKG